VPLSFRLAPGCELAFRPLDFIQVNAKLNEKMIAHALDLLDREDERVLDLFCGLGNFTLPLARVREVVGVEGDAGLVARGVRTPSATAWPTRSSSAPT
jgi:23S rRNA (uracil1939-C5)-methyltransferase